MSFLYTRVVVTIRLKPALKGKHQGDITNEDCQAYPQWLAPSTKVPWIPDLFLWRDAVLWVMGVLRAELQYFTSPAAPLTFIVPIKHFGVGQMNTALHQQAWAFAKWQAIKTKKEEEHITKQHYQKHRKWRRIITCIQRGSSMWLTVVVPSCYDPIRIPQLRGKGC